MDVETMLADLAEVVHQAGRERREALVLEAAPAAGNA
jgi:hypothetical protein